MWNWNTYVIKRESHSQNRASIDYEYYFDTTNIMKISDIIQNCWLFSISTFIAILRSSRFKRFHDYYDYSKLKDY